MIIKKIVQDMMTLGKTLLLSRRPSPASRSRKDVTRGDTIVVMGNGPSLRDVIADDFEILVSYPRMAVNFAANAPEFFRLRPGYYVLADPHFFRGYDSDPNVGRLWKNLAAVEWPMHLWLPVRFRREIWALVSRLPASVEVKWFNLTPGEGGGAMTRRLYSLGLAMPRPRNVLIPAIMLALREGFRDVVVVGADHSWLQSLFVDDLNRVVSVQPHFYKDDSKELDRVAQEYAGYHLHDILGSMTVAFRSYFDIKDYADSIGAKIVNATPGSYIDAFPRLHLRSLSRSGD